jgi:hypothetical protein
MIFGGLLGVPKFFFSKSFSNDVESTILGRSVRQRKKNENFFKEKNVCHIKEHFKRNPFEMSNIILINI